MKNLNDQFFINSLVFDIEPLKIIKQYQDNYSLDKILDLIKDFIVTYNDFQSFDDYMAQNIYDILNYIRYNYKYSNLEQKKEKFEIFSFCLSQLNNRMNTNSEDFYMSQFISRGMNYDYFLLFKQYILPDDIKENIRASLCFDKFFYEIISKNISNVSNSEMELLIMNTMFIYSVNYFYLECPEILDNNMLLKKVLIENKKILSNFKLRFLNNTKYETTNSLKKSTKFLLKEFRWS